MTEHGVRAVLREPLLHFFVMGALIFGVYAWMARQAVPSADAEARVVRITATEVEWLRQGFARQWQRPPTPQELAGLAADTLRERLLAREAQALGLGDDDTIVRRRLAQKMLFIVEDAARLGEPSDDELSTFHAAHAAQFVTRPRRSFEQVYFDPGRRSDAAADARSALAAASRGQLDPARGGDPLMVEARYTDIDEATVANAFGPAFAADVFGLPAGQWQGPIESGYGLHLVRVSAIDAPRQRTFLEAKDEVRARWREDKQREGVDDYFVRLLAKYDITIDPDVQAALGPLDTAALRPVRGGGGGRTR